MSFKKKLLVRSRNLRKKVKKLVETRLKFLGSGSAWPIPRLGCKCYVCEDARREDSKSRRTRPSILLEHGNKKILVDCTPDFYSQMIREEVEDLDYLLISHIHNDHVAGLDDILPVIERKNEKMTLVTSEEVYKELKKKFDYLMGNFNEKLLKFGDYLEIDGLKISYVPVMHGVYTLGFIFEGNKKIVYLSDITHPLEKKFLEKIMSADYLILDGSEIASRSPRFHLSLESQLEMALEAKAKNVIFTHIGHGCPLHEELEELVKKLHPNSRIAYDGMII
jgi:phosphoribosyl 1,2-cyclic phosphate phosphodiesterase